MLGDDLMSRLGWMALGLALFGFASVFGEEVQLLRMDFDDAAKDPPVLALLGGPQREVGIVRTTTQANWQRGGAQIGPIPTPEKSLIVQYDFRPMQFGRQCQEFTSQLPSTHWYMMYADPKGRLHLHTHEQGEWKARATSQNSLRVGEWYTTRVTLTRTSIAFRIAEKATGNLVWETPEPVKVDDLGDQVLFILCDESADANAGSTEWDNVALSTDDAALAQRLAATMKAALQEREEQDRRRRAAVTLGERGIALLPMPQDVKLGSGSFRLPETPTLKIEAGCDNADAAVVRMALKERLNRDAQEKPEAADIVLKRPAAPAPSLQAYRLIVGEKGVQLEASSPQGFFYAALTLCQLVGADGTVPAVEITDAPAIENRLVMIAIDQGGFQNVDVDYWKRIVRELAAVKITHIMPYFEGGGFLYKKYPFATIKGENGFTHEKARELSEYAHERFVEMLPQQQTLGHSGSILSHEELKDLRESGDVYCSSNPRTFEFLGDLFDELCEAFPYSRSIHCGGDEFAQGFAKCPKCKARAEKIGLRALYAEHMMRLHEMLAQRKRGMMIWWHEQGYTEEAADLLAKDIVIFDWHYGNQSAYPSLDRLHTKGFMAAWATPAVTRYYSGTDDFDNTFGNIQGFLRAGAKANVPGECTCTWVHGIWGGRNTFELNLYALLWSAECSWNPVASDAETFRSKYARHWFGLDGAQRGDEVLNAVHAPFGPTKEQGFWRDCRVLEPIITEKPAVTAKRLSAETEPPAPPKAGKPPAKPLEKVSVPEAEQLLKVCAPAREILERWQKEVKQNKVTVDYLLHDVHIHETAARKILAVAALTKAWDEAKAKPQAERAAVLAPALAQLEAINKDLVEIEEMFRRSVHEAGGGECGWGGWVPFIAGGGVWFRTAEGRKNIEDAIAGVRKSLTTEPLPLHPF